MNDPTRSPDDEPTVIDEAFHNEEVAAGHHRIEPAGLENALWRCRCGAAFTKYRAANAHIAIYLTIDRIIDADRSSEET